MYKHWRTCLLIAGIWATTAQANEVQITPSLEMHYQTAGSGPITLLLVPGWTMSGEVYERQLAHYRHSENYTVYAIDPIGQGHSSKPVNGYSYTQRGKDLEAFVDKLKLKNIVLAGWSYGSLDVLSYVQQYGTSKLKGPVIIDGPPKAVGDDNTKEWVWYSRSDADGSRQSYTMGALDNRLKFTTDFVKWMLESPTDKAVKHFVDISLQTSDTVAALTNESGAYADYTATLSELNGHLPLLFVARDEWKTTTQTWATAHAPDAKIVAMGKHLMFWEKADAFNAELDTFLKDQVH